MFGVSSRWVITYCSIIFISLISKITGYFRDSSVTAIFGASVITDAYIIALLIPEVLFNVFGNSLTANFAPLYFEARQRNRHRAFVSTLFSLYIVLAALIFIIGFFKTDTLIHIFSPGFSGTAFTTTTFLLKIFMANVFSLTITYFFLVYLQAHNRFLLPASIGITFNLAIILSMWNNSSPSPLYMLIIGTIAGYVFQFLLQLPQVFFTSPGIRYWQLSFTPEVKKYIMLSLPIAGLAVLGQLNIAMDNYFASNLETGSITTLNLGYRVLMGVYSLFITNTMMFIHPALSKSVVQKNTLRTVEILQRVTNWLTIVLLPLSFYLFITAQPILDLMFKRGAFTAEKSLLTAFVFKGYIVGLIFYAFRDLLIRYYYAENNTVFPLLNGLLNSSLNFVFLIILVPFLHLPGVSVATALSSVSSFLVLYTRTRRKEPLFTQVRFFGFAPKILFVCCITVILYKLTIPFIDIPGDQVLPKTIQLLCGFIAFCLYYFICLLAVFHRKLFGFFIR